MKDYKLRLYVLDFNTFVSTTFVIAKSMFFYSSFLLIGIIFFTDKSLFLERLLIYILVVVVMTVVATFICYLIHYLKMKRTNDFESFIQLDVPSKARRIASALRLDNL